MKIIVVGLGQCGGRIADQFARIGIRALARRKVQIITGTFAVNTDEADLTGLKTVRTDYQHRIVLGGRKTSGHGVGKINEVGAQIAREGGDRVVDAMRASKRFYETDAFLLIAGAAGGTGSGGLPVITEFIKQRYGDKPVYAMVVLPFEHEEHTEERSIYNTATCLKSTFSVADAVFLVDNQRYLHKTPIKKIEQINQRIVEPFYNILCAGEEKKRKYIGGKVVDAGDIIQTLGGWSAIGFGRSQGSMLRNPFASKRHFRKQGTETHIGIHTMDQALGELSIACKPQDARSAI